MLKKIIFFILLTITLIVYFIPIIFTPIPGTDAGVFMYIGKLVLEGYVPYRDIFDHKGPLLYFINSLGFLISQGNVEGVRLLEILFLILSVIFSYLVLTKYYEKLAAFVAILSWLIPLPLIMAYGNYSEEYALLFQFAGLWYFYRYQTYSSQKDIIFFGITLGCVIALRPNLIGIHGAIFLYWLFEHLKTKQRKKFIYLIACIIIGIAIVFIPVFIYFYYHKGLFDLWDQVFVFNKTYSTGEWSIRWRNFKQLFVFNFQYGLSVIGVIGGLIALLRFRKTKISKEKEILFVALVSFPFTIIMILLSLRADVNYYIMLLPSYALLAGILFNCFISVFKNKAIYVVGFILIVSALLPLRYWIGLFKQNIIDKKNRYKDVISYINEQTNVQDNILMWGAETRINFVTERKSPTKYVYQWPLYRVGYVKETHVKRFFDDIVQNKPVLIIDTKNGNFPGIDEEQKQKWLTTYQSPYHQMPSGMDSVIHYIQKNYIKLDTSFSCGWDVYRIRTMR